MTPTWQRRLTPLSPAGLLAEGEVARTLATALAAEPQRLTPLRGVVGDGLLVLLGDAADLPWRDGVVYIAPDPSQAALWTPVHQQLDLPADWLVPHLPSAPSLLVDTRCIPLRGARSLSAPALAAWR